MLACLEVDFNSVDGELQRAGEPVFLFQTNWLCSDRCHFAPAASSSFFFLTDHCDSLLHNLPPGSLSRGVKLKYTDGAKFLTLGRVACKCDIYLLQIEQ